MVRSSFGHKIWRQRLNTPNANRVIKQCIKAFHPTIWPHKRFMHLMIHPRAQQIWSTSSHSLMSSSRTLTSWSYLTWFLMLCDDNMQVMTWASTSTYEGNKKHLGSIKSKNFCRKKKTLGSRRKETSITI